MHSHYSDTRATLLIAILALSSCIAALSQFFVTPMMPVVAEDIGSTVPLVGQTITAGFLLGALIALLIGPIGDHYGHRRLMIVGLLLVMLSAIASAVAIDYWTLLISRLPGSIGGGVVASIAIVLAQTHFPEEKRRAAIGWVVTGISAAPIAGIPAIAFTAEYFDWRTSFLAFGILSLFCLGLLLWLAAPDPPAENKPFHVRAIFNAYPPLIRHRTSRILQISNLLRAIGWGAAGTYVAAYLIDVKGFSLQEIGYFAMVAGIGYFVGTRLGDGRYGRVSLRLLFSALTALMGVLLAIIFILPVPVLIIVLLYLVAITACGAGFVALTIMIAEESPAGRSTTMMLRQSSFMLGMAAGGALGGLAITAGYPVFGLGVFVFLIWSALLPYWPALRSRPVALEAPPGAESAASQAQSD